ncbi:MAG: hypothetical protein ABSB40_05000 [Nitrososphaeria archaeon]
MSKKIWDPLKKNYKERYLLVKNIPEEQAQALLNNFRPDTIIPKILQISLSTKVPKAEEIRKEV